MMNSYVESAAKCEIYAVIFFLTAKGERPEVHRQYYASSKSHMSIQKLRKSVHIFQVGRNETDDKPHSGSPSDDVNVNSTVTVQAIVDADAWLKFVGLLLFPCRLKKTSLYIIHIWRHIQLRNLPFSYC